MDNNSDVATNLKKVVHKSHYEIVLPDFLKQSAGLNEATFRREVSFLVQAVQANNYLAGSDPDSFRKVILNVAQTGLTLNPTLGYAYCVPRYNRSKQRLEACLDPGYRGYIKMLSECPGIASIQCQLVYTNDEFIVDLSSNKKIVKHTFDIFNTEGRGEVVGAYSLARLSSGEYHVEIMTKVDIIKIRDNSEAYKAFKNKKTQSAIWEDHFEEMCRKTVIRRHFKYLPKDAQTERIARAVELDDEIHGVVKEPSEPQRTLAYNLLESSVLGTGERDNIYQAITESELAHEISEIIEYLQTQQPDEELASMEQIQDKVSEKVNADPDPDDIPEGINFNYKAYDQKLAKTRSMNTLKKLYKSLSENEQADTMVKRITNRHKARIEKLEAAKAETPEAEEVQDIELEVLTNLEDMVQACQDIEELEALVNEGISEDLVNLDVVQKIIERKRKEFKNG